MPQWNVAVKKTYEQKIILEVEANCLTEAAQKAAASDGEVLWAEKPICLRTEITDMYRSDNSYSDKSQ